MHQAVARMARQQAETAVRRSHRESASAHSMADSDPRAPSPRRQVRKTRRRPATRPSATTPPSQRAPVEASPTPCSAVGHAMAELRSHAAAAPGKERPAHRQQRLPSPSPSAQVRRSASPAVPRQQPRTRGASRSPVVRRGANAPSPTPATAKVRRAGPSPRVPTRRRAGGGTRVSTTSVSSVSAWPLQTEGSAPAPGGGSTVVQHSSTAIADDAGMPSPETPGTDDLMSSHRTAPRGMSPDIHPSAGSGSSAKRREPLSGSNGKSRSRSAGGDDDWHALRREQSRWQRLREEMDSENKRLSGALQAERANAAAERSAASRLERLLDDVREMLGVGSNEAIRADLLRLRAAADPQKARRRDSELRSAREDAVAASRRVKELERELHSLNASAEALTELRLEHDAASSDFIRVSQSNSALRQELRDVTGELATVQQTVVAQEVALAQKDEQVRDLTSRADRCTAELKDVRQELRRCEQLSDKKESESAAECSRLNRQLLETRSLADGREVSLELDLAERKAHIVQQDYDLGSLRSKVADLEFDLQALREDNARLASAASLAVAAGLCKAPAVGQPETLQRHDSDCSRPSTMTTERIAPTQSLSPSPARGQLGSDPGQ
eukprot:TRINITY_DN20117_c0_g1_i2.p1 TRINITY_DN20117_c0_g1~~TRINITY_DN20117_c0_g1_i2.p1  ORF type:complete len:633 (+),score=186.32 TRINITY_DN20117_c0_g1_i2:52-1899(+)